MTEIFSIANHLIDRSNRLTFAVGNTIENKQDEVRCFLSS